MEEDMGMYHKPTVASAGIRINWTPHKKPKRKKARCNQADTKDRTTEDGHVFDSKTEMKRYYELKLMSDAGQIKNLQMQVPFELQPKFLDDIGKPHRAIIYVCDFMYEELDGRIVVEDVKSTFTRTFPEYRLKKKMFMFKYPQYHFFENVM